MLAALFAAVAVQSAPPFEFRDVRSDLTRSEAERSRLVERCHADVLADRPVTTCFSARRLWQGGISGYEFYGLMLSFDGTALAALDAGILPQGFAPVRSAFTQKFGEPCAIEQSVVTNAFGAAFPQETVRWCLADGDLELRRLATQNLQRSQIVFVSSRFLQMPPPAGTVNF